jgi:small subunit ribosomal protein S6
VRKYELTFIVRPDISDDAVNAAVEQVQNWITNEGNEVTRVDHWGRRRLAYPIRDQREGHYVKLDVSVKAESIAAIERNLKLNDAILRHLLVRLDEN